MNAQGDVTIITYHDGPVEKHGGVGVGRYLEYTFTMEWYDADGEYRPERQFGAKGGAVVGYHRGQVFRADPAPYIERAKKRGPVVEIDGRGR